MGKRKIIVLMIVIFIVIIVSIVFSGVKNINNKKSDEIHQRIYTDNYDENEYMIVDDSNNVRFVDQIKKPIIYLYPTEKQEVTVKLKNENNIICSYPKYKDEWKVEANPNGEMVDLNTGKSLYALYYESENVIDFDIKDEGFVVSKENVSSFLEEKLEILGLNERESEEFIIYWLPKLENNKYNYIRFATMEEINKNMPLEVSGNPDTIIRVLMEFKGLENPIDVKEQLLQKRERVGFTVVEWGGTELR